MESDEHKTYKCKCGRIYETEEELRQHMYSDITTPDDIHEQL
jgi:hypothetical protein